MTGGPYSDGKRETSDITKTKGSFDREVRVGGSRETIASGAIESRRDFPGRAYASESPALSARYQTARVSRFVVGRIAQVSPRRDSELAVSNLHRSHGTLANVLTRERNVTPIAQRIARRIR